MVNAFKLKTKIKTKIKPNQRIKPLLKSKEAKCTRINDKTVPPQVYGHPNIKRS